MAVSPDQFLQVAASLNRMEESMKHMVKSDDIKAVVTEAVTEATKKMGERQDQIEKQFKDLKTEFDKIMIEIRKGAVTQQGGPTMKRRALSSGPGSRDTAREPTVIIKQFPHPMWRRRIIEIGEALIKTRIPNHVTFKANAVDNTKLMKATFDNHKDAESFINSCRADPLIFKVGEVEHPLKVHWDKSPEDRTKGWVISQLWSAVDGILAEKGVPHEMGCRTAFGHVLGSAGNDDAPQVLFTVSDDGSSVEPDVQALAAFSISESQGRDIIAAVFAKKRS